MHPQKRRPGQRRDSAPIKPRHRPEYIAAVRYPDGSRDLFHVRNADDIDDARELVISEVGDLLSLVIALRA